MSPLSKHFSGKGEKVMAAMKKQYGSDEKAKKVFYSTANRDKKQTGIRTKR